MEIPVYENESPVGMLRISRQGLYTVFEARLPAAPVGTTVGRPSSDAASVSTAEQCSALRRQAPHSELPLTRLWVQGGGRWASLGLLRPDKAGRSLRRRLTRLDCRALPPRIEGAVALPDGETPVGEGLSALHRYAPPGEARSPCRDDHGSSAPGLASVSRAEQCSALRHRLPPSESSWQPRPDGSLIDPARRLLALPCELRADTPGLRRQRIGEREFLVFRY